MRKCNVEIFISLSSKVVNKFAGGSCDGFYLVTKATMRRTHLSHYPFVSNKECAFRRNPQAGHKFEWTDNPNVMRVIPRGYKHHIAPSNYRVYYYRFRRL